MKRLYSIWVIFSIVVFFFVFFVPIMICVPIKKLHRLALWINWVWAWGFFKLSLIPVELEWRAKPDLNQQFILCANHFSYLDIPALGLFPRPFKFVGKSSLGKIPLFGTMYNRLHITVNRASYKSRAKSLRKARQEIDRGFSLGFFPEGGIKVQEYPNMASFKDGAFRLATENQIPIIPITMPHNYFALKDDEIFAIKRTKIKLIIHEAIWPKGYGEKNARILKEEVFEVLQSELDRFSGDVKVV